MTRITIEIIGLVYAVAVIAFMVIIVRLIISMTRYFNNKNNEGKK